MGMGTGGGGYGCGNLSCCLTTHETMAASSRGAPLDVNDQRNEVGRQARFEHRRREEAALAFSDVGERKTAYNYALQGTLVSTKVTLDPFSCIPGPKRSARQQAIRDRARAREHLVPKLGRKDAHINGKPPRDENDSDDDLDDDEGWVAETPHQPPSTPILVDSGSDTEADMSDDDVTLGDLMLRMNETF